jgi:hypothetical protein
VTNDVDLAQLDERQLRELVRSVHATIEADMGERDRVIRDLALVLRRLPLLRRIL